MKFALISAIALLLTGCSWLPSTGPTARAIDDQATADGQARFDVIEVDDRVVDILRKETGASFQSKFGRYGKPPEKRIAVGDIVVVSIWEGGDDTLFGTGVTIDHTVTTGSRGVTLPEQMVPDDGMITVPFVGRVLVRGKTVAQAQQLIQTLLVGKTPAPQVIVSVPKSSSDTVTIAGEVVKGARVPLSPEGDRLLDVIATAGGAEAPVYDIYVRLSREGLTTTIPYQTLVDVPAENVYAWPGDVLTLVRVPHSFEAFGETGKNAHILFDQERLNVAQALAKSSGLLDERADPAGVFLLREEPLPLVRQLDPKPADWHTPLVPVVYHFDWHDAKTFFLAQNFPVENNDVLYVAPAEANALQKFFALLGTVTSPIVTGIILNNTTP